MTLSAAETLQTAIVAALKADATLNTIFSGPPTVVDFVDAEDGDPSPVILPYIFLGEMRENEDDWGSTDGLAKYGKEHLFEIHVWSSYEGKAECYRIKDAIERALRDNVALSLTDHALVNIRFTGSTVMRDPDGQAYHAITAWRAKTEETT